MECLVLRPPVPRQSALVQRLRLHHAARVAGVQSSAARAAGVQRSSVPVSGARRGGLLRCHASAEESVTPRTARQLKRALEALGVDTSDCFERADLETKWSKLNEAQKAAGSFVQEDALRSEEAASKGAASASSFDAVAWASEALQPARLQLERLQASLSESGRFISSGEAAAAARARLGAAWEEADSAYGLDAKARRATQAVRDAVRKADASLGAGAWVRSNGPAIWKALQEFRATPVGQALSFAATAWLFLSGAFWTFLSWSFLALLVTNFVAPTLLRGALEDAVSAAAEQAAARGGGMPPGGAAGFGGPGAGGASSGGPPPGVGRRRDLSGSAGPVVDVDADVVDV